MKGIICLGDSITHGRGEQPSKSWAGRLKKDFETIDRYNSVYNLGIPGDTSTLLVKRINTELKYRIKYKRPDDAYTVIIAIGINDTRKTNKTKFEKNIKKIIQITKKHTKKIYVIGLTPIDEHLRNSDETTNFSNNKISEYNEIIEKISKKQKVKFIDILKEFQKIKYSNLLSDGLHPNKKGYDFIYKHIKKVLVKYRLLL